jgi:two-component system nitrogen regulation response regulator NtrX
MVVPPLRERREDIPELAAVLFAQIAEKNRTTPKQLSPEGLKILQNYSWPGNIRELKNLLDRLSIMVSGDMIAASDIPAPYNPKSPVAESVDSALFDMDRLDQAMAVFEKEFILRKLAENNEDITKTAKRIGVSKSYIQKRTNLK